ncbi:MAG TPA: SCP2 sterol-binding domain-containing protein [Acidimicrobiia bacterium]
MAQTVKFLTREWVDLVRTSVVGRDVRGAAHSTSVQIVVNGAPDGETTWHARVDHEKVDAELGPAADADIVLTVTYADAVAIVQGALEPSVAFMQGRMKTAGDSGQLLDLLAATSSSAFRDARARIAATTEV